MKLKRILCLLGLLLSSGLFLMLFQDNWVARGSQKENHCFTCHTSARKLIKITREIARAQEAEPVAAVKSEGEG